MSVESRICSLSISELKELCKQKGIKGYSKLKKDELLQICITGPVPRSEGHCKVHQIDIKEVIGSTPYDDENDPFTDVDNKPSALKLRKKLLKVLQNKRLDLRRGDLIEIIGINPYRNDGLLIYDGDKIQPLDYNIDE